MPRPTKLHKKIKSTSIQKPNSVPNQAQPQESEEDPGEARRRFELELCWCIQQLEKQLKSDAAKKDEKKAQDLWKALSTLKSNNHPMVRKRQLMRTYFGDYRSKMAKEEKKVNKMISNVKIAVPSNAKGTFLRKSLFQTPGNEKFHFNFQLKSEDLVDNCSKLTINDEKLTCGNPMSESRKHDDPNKSTIKFNFGKPDFKFNFKNDSRNDSL